VIDRLAAYEDTNLTPEEIKSLLRDGGIGIAIRNRELREENKRLTAELARVTAERDAAIEKATCGCGICLAHNNWVCPKMADGKEEQAADENNLE